MEGLLALTQESGGGALVSGPHTAALQQVATRLLVAAGPPPVNKAAKSVLYAVHPSRKACHWQTDGALLQHSATAVLLAGEGEPMDVEQFHQLVVTARTIATARPLNLASFARRFEAVNEEGIWPPMADTTSGQKTGGPPCHRFVDLLLATFWRLLDEIPANSASGGLGQPGLTHVELTVQFLVDILHALTLADMEHMASVTAGHYIKFLLCPDQRVAFSARAAIVRAVRPKPKKRRGGLAAHTSSGGNAFLPDVAKDSGGEAPPERPSAPAPPVRSSAANSRRQQQQQQQQNNLQRRLQEQEQMMDYEEGDDDHHPHHDLNRGPGGVHLGGVAGNLDALLPLGGHNLPAMLDMPADEAMVELAIALSLQDQEDGEGGEVGGVLAGLQQLANLDQQGLAGILGAAAQEQDSDSEDVVEEADEDGEEDEEDDDGEEDEDEGEEEEEEDEEEANRSRRRRRHHHRRGGDNNVGDSDSTASAPGSDEDEEREQLDEGRPSAAEPGGGRSDSGGSLDDITARNNTASGFCSHPPEGEEDEGEEHRDEAHPGATLPSSRQEDEDGGAAASAEGQLLAAGLRQVLLEKLVESLGALRAVGGPCTIPFLQLALALTTDLDPEDDRDVAALHSLLAALLQELLIGESPAAAAVGSSEPAINYAERHRQREFQLIIMRLLSVLMSRSVRSSPPPVSSAATGHWDAATADGFVARTVAATLAAQGMHGHCLTILKSLLPYWQSQTSMESSTALAAPDDMAAAAEPAVPGSQLLKPSPPSPLPDMAPFFLKQYVKSHAADIFEAYPQLLTEMALRIPYQMKKIAESGGPEKPAPHFEGEWLYQLCELLGTPQAPFVKRQVRKLLLLICGSREKYRQLRDMHILETKLRLVTGFHIVQSASIFMTRPLCSYATAQAILEQDRICTS
jgi:E3 ubiquitin-protein ligase UBR4